jgi:hypothetical protein
LLDRGGIRLEREQVCHYLKVIVVVELLVTLAAGMLITNLHPYWMQLLAYTYLPVADLITIVVWLVCRRLRDRQH